MRNDQVDYSEEATLSIASEPTLASCPNGIHYWSGIGSRRTDEIGEW